MSPLDLGDKQGSAVALGYFDGIHLGHRAVIGGAVDWARAHGAAPAVFTFQLPITGKHSIEARSGERSSVILVNKVDAPNPDYAMDNRKNVNNWFDGELDASCWSVKDNMAKAMADPKAGPILKQISDKAAAARGDVAAAVKDNPALVAMMERAMQRMTIESMLMQAGASEEDIKQLNRVLQGISKE